MPCHCRPCLMYPRALFNCYPFDVTICVEHNLCGTHGLLQYSVLWCPSFQGLNVCVKAIHTPRNTIPPQRHRIGGTVHSICSKTCVRSAVCDVVGSLRLCIFIIRFAMSLRCHRNAPTDTHSEAVRMSAVSIKLPLRLSPCRILSLHVSVVCRSPDGVRKRRRGPVRWGKRWRALQVPPAAEATDDLDR